MKIRPVVPRSLAVRDVDLAVDHYLGEGGAAAALGFIAALERAYGHIARHPASGSIRYAQELDLSDLRFWPLRRYPYLVFYVARDDHIDVWRVLQAGRDIPAWMCDPDELLAAREL